jgi:hypothetical protein
MFKYLAFFTPFIRKRRGGTAYPALAKSLGMTRSSLLIGEWAEDHFD